MSSCSLCLPPPFVHQREGEAKESASLAPPTHRVVPTHTPLPTSTLKCKYLLFILGHVVFSSSFLLQIYALIGVLLQVEIMCNSVPVYQNGQI